MQQSSQTSSSSPAADGAIRSRTLSTSCSVFLSTASFSVLLAYFLAATSWAGAPPSDSCSTTSLDLSNGTHFFRKTVVLVSFDGLSSDYLLRGRTPHLTNISKQGIRAEYMKPIFPTLTFPNHWSLLTGLYAESHGIIANDFHDPQYRSTFVSNRPGTSESRWWLGEPIWETVERAGLSSANIMWPGPLVTTSGVAPRYQVSFMPGYSPEDKITQVLEWIDLPLEKRPQLIIVYEPILDQAGHKAGPESELVNKTLATVSNFAHALVQGLHNERNLSHVVDILLVSDHGMEDTSSWEMVYMDDILCHEPDKREQGWPACAGVQYVDGWPSMGLWLSPGVNATTTLSRLVLASESKKFDVYTTDMYTQNNSDTTSMVPKMPTRMGYALTDRVENGSLMSTGNHGYDNNESSMRAVFISTGPFAKSVREQYQEEYVFPPFESVELYNLIVRLLGIDEWASETNGTKGFWDQWTTFDAR